MTNNQSEKVVLFHGQMVLSNVHGKKKYAGGHMDQLLRKAVNSKSCQSTAKAAGPHIKFNLLLMGITLMTYTCIRV